jgi:hypothetical protein
MPDENYFAFQHLMSKIPAGKIEDNKDLSSEIASALSRVWETLDGGVEGGMSGDKLHGRMEEIEWAPPLLTFAIERHGGTVKGSVYADLQTWTVDVEKSTARVSVSRGRLLSDRQPRFDVGPLVTEIKELILAGKEDDRLKWQVPGRRVRVQIGKVIPGTGIARQTFEGRRRRFREHLDKALADVGWNPVRGRYNTYENTPDDA